MAERFPGFDDVEYPDWRTFFQRLRSDARQAQWPGPFVLDELPYLIAADAGIVSVVQNWLDSPEASPSLVVSGSSQQMMHGAVLDAGAPLFGRAVEAFAVRPLRPGTLRDAFPGFSSRDLVSVYALWGGMPRYWELAAPFGSDRTKPSTPWCSILPAHFTTNPIDCSWKRRRLRWRCGQCSM